MKCSLTRPIQEEDECVQSYICRQQIYISELEYELKQYTATLGSLITIKNEIREIERLMVR